MGSGKSTVGRELARRLERPFVDNDEQLEAMTGRSARELQRDVGREALHGLERAAVLAALDGEVPAVITAAASVVDDAPTRVVLHERAFVVWLDAATDVLARRAASQPHRPLGDDAEGALAAQARARDELFRSVAHLAVSTETSVEEAVEEILRAMRTPRR
jgi:shikimate kinase